MHNQATGFDKGHESSGSSSLSFSSSSATSTKVISNNRLLKFPSKHILGSYSSWAIVLFVTARMIHQLLSWMKPPYSVVYLSRTTENNKLIPYCVDSFDFWISIRRFRSTHLSDNFSNLNKQRLLLQYKASQSPLSELSENSTMREICTSTLLLPFVMCASWEHTPEI